MESPISLQQTGLPVFQHCVAIPVRGKLEAYFHLQVLLRRGFERRMGRSAIRTMQIGALYSAMLHKMKVRGTSNRKALTAQC